MDTHVVVVNKPAGVSTIPFDEKEKGTLDELVRNVAVETHEARGARDAARASASCTGSTRRRAASSCSRARWLAKQSLTQQFRAHTVHRRYLAIAHGVGAGEDVAIASRRGPRRRPARLARGGRGGGGEAEENEGQLAITHVEPVEALEGATLVACALETGRTHQIRVHLSEAGHPMVGERVYMRGFRGEVIPAPRLMLHAAELGFVHPATNAEVRFEREPPGDFEETVGRLRG